MQVRLKSVERLVFGQPERKVQMQRTLSTSQVFQNREDIRLPTFQKQTHYTCTIISLIGFYARNKQYIKPQLDVGA